MTNLRIWKPGYCIQSLCIAAVWLTAAAVAPGADPAVEAPSRPPNIVLIYADNLGYGDLGCYGNQYVKTPRIDRLASEGVRCTQFYVVTSSCTPSRGAILTGRYPLRNGLAHQLVTSENWHGIGLPHRERILPQYLKPAGYATGCFGKWNIGFARGSRPTERGFDEFFGFRSGNIHYFRHTYHGEYDMFRGTEPHRVEGYSTELFAEAACRFIRAQAGGPFFVYLPFNAMHCVGAPNVAPGEKAEWLVPGKYLERYGRSADEPDPQRRYWAVLTALDDGVGRVLDTLDELRLRENTLVMFISDMGAVWTPACQQGVASNGPFRDGSPSVYEGGVRVPAVFRWPGRIPAGTQTDELLSQLDIVPLCLSVAGVRPPADRVLDGVDALPVLSGKEKSPHQVFAYGYARAAAFREANLKIVRTRPDRPWELYDLAKDPTESTDLAAIRPADVARLAKAYDAWKTDAARDASRPERYEPPKSPGNQPAGSASSTNMK
jgi:arylsulfatase A-like enzyme